MINPGASVEYTRVTEKSDVTDELADAAYEIADGWYQGERIDWEDVLDRLDGLELHDGSLLDLGSDLLSPAVKEIKRRVMRMRAEG